MDSIMKNNKNYNKVRSKANKKSLNVVGDNGK